MSGEAYRALNGELTAVFHFDVDDLHIAQNLTGQALETTSGGKTVRIVMPNAQGRFRPQILSSLRPITGSQSRTEGDSEPLLIIRHVQVQVDLARGLGDEGSGNAEYVLLREALPEATRVLRQVIDWARTIDRQEWLLPPHLQPSLSGPAVLMNQAGERTHGYPIRQRGALVLLDPAQLPTGQVAQGLDLEEVPQAESLLAEARWAVWPTQDPDTKRAVLFAAIALEVKVPQALRAMADGTSERLLEVLFERPDESQMSTNFQLNAVAEIFGGEALRHHDGKLDKDIKSLFKLRNHVAHRGHTPELTKSREAVAAAERVFDWLDARTGEAVDGADGDQTADLEEGGAPAPGSS